MQNFYLSFAPILLFGCVEVAPVPTTVMPAAISAAQPNYALGRAIADEQCSGCHAVRTGVEPPNPQAPSFVTVANEMGFTKNTLREFFRDGHETPAAMSIELDEEDAEAMAVYIMSLREKH